MKWMPVFMVLATLLMVNDGKAEITLCKDSQVSHEPRADVTHGDPVMMTPDPVMVPVTVDMAERFDLNTSEGVEMDSYLGMMEIYKDGRILYDGKDISGDIEDVCNDNFDTLLNEQTVIEQDNE